MENNITVNCADNEDNQTKCDTDLATCTELLLKLDRDIDKKREDYLEWKEYFMAVAFLSAMRSKDPSSQVGACIVDNQNRIIGVGYNGMPTGCSDDLLPWNKTSENRLETKYMYVHATYFERKAWRDGKVVKRRA